MITTPSIIKVLKFITTHPLNRGYPLGAIKRFVSWQVSSHILGAPVILPFVDSTVLVVSPGSTGATGNWYCGLHEYAEMCFVLKVLRPEDLFLDVGANIGSYTVLASGAVGAKAVAFEPVPATFRRLVANIQINELSELVTARQEGVSDRNGILRFTLNNDTTNRVLPAQEDEEEALEVPVVSLDSAIAEGCPTLIKIDVEGQELPVLRGASRLLSNPDLLAVIAESNQSGERYGHTYRDLVNFMWTFGFAPFEFEPQDCALRPTSKTIANLIFIRDIAEVRERISSSRRSFRLCNDAVV